MTVECLLKSKVFIGWKFRKQEKCTFSETNSRIKGMIRIQGILSNLAHDWNRMHKQNDAEGRHEVQEHQIAKFRCSVLWKHKHNSRN